MTKKPLKYKGLSDIPEAPICYGSTEVINTGLWRTLRPVLVLEKCTKCYICWKFCPDVSISINKETGFPEIDYYYCKGCGICANECKKDAIKMEREEFE